jgi:hypothetical protein
MGLDRSQASVAGLCVVLMVFIVFDNLVPNCIPAALVLSL